MRILTVSLCMATLAASLMACNKPPVKGTAYQCHSGQTGPDIFLRLDADGSVNLGPDGSRLKPIVWTARYDEGEVATWTIQAGGATTTDVFDKAKGVLDATYDPGPPGKVEHVHYSCQAI